MLSIGGRCDDGEMDALIGIGVLVAILLPFGARALRQTRIWWMPGALLFVGAIAMFGQTESTHGDVGGMQALANGVLMLTGIGLSVLSVIALASAAGLAQGGPQPNPCRSSQLRSPQLSRPTARTIEVKCVFGYGDEAASIL